MTGKVVIVLVWSATIVSPLSLRAQDRALQTRLKAEVVAKATQFVRWPATAIDGRQTIEFCVVKSDPFGPALDQLVNGDVMDGRPLAVRRIEPDQHIDGCHVLFLSSSVMAARPSFVRRARGR